MDRRELALEKLTVQSLKANEVIEWKAFSWTRLFNLMEQIQPWDIRMTSIRPIFSQWSVFGGKWDIPC